MRNNYQNEKQPLSVHPVRNWPKRLVGRVGIEPTTRGLKDRKTIVSYLSGETEISPIVGLLIGASLPLILAALVFFSCSIGNTTEPQGIAGIREKFIAINADFSRLLGPKAKLVNVGSAVNAGDGDLLTIALDKVDQNLRLIEASR